MRILFILLGIISAILGLALSILPFGKIALFPIIGSLIFCIIAFKLSQKERLNTTVIKITFLITIIGLAFNIYNSLKPNEIIVEQNQIENDLQAQEEDLEELEDIDIDIE